MTELQMGLISLGSAAVIGVLVYNKWQEHKHRRIAAQVLENRHADVLLSESSAVVETSTFTDAASEFAAPTEKFVPSTAMHERLEPMLRCDPQSEDDEAIACDSSSESLATPPLESANPAPAAVPTAPPAIAPAPHAKRDEAPEPKELPKEIREAKEVKETLLPLHLLSPVIDYIASFEAVEPAPAYQILDSQHEALGRVRKPIRWIGYNERSREWEAIVDEAGSEYRRIRIGLQLVDRHGPARDSDLSIFHVAMQDLADELMAVADLPPRQPALDTALQLDQFCAGVDIQIGINVISQGQSFPGTKLRALAEAAGMALDVEGRFVRCDDEGRVLFLLTNHEAAGFSAESMKTMHTHGVTFLLDVPRVAHGDRLFNQMLDLARRFAEALHGTLVDDNRRPLSEGALEPIRRQIAQYQATMAARNLPAGGPLTLRLFA